MRHAHLTFRDSVAREEQLLSTSQGKGKPLRYPCSQNALRWFAALPSGLRACHINAISQGVTERSLLCHQASQLAVLL